MVTRRAFLGWTGLTGYGTWALLKPVKPHAKPPRPTTTIAPTTTIQQSGSVWSAVWPSTW